MAHNEKCEAVEAIGSAIQETGFVFDDFFDFIILRIFDSFASKVQHFFH